MDSGAPEHLTPDATTLYDFVTAGPRTTLEIVSDTHEEVKDYGKLDLLVKQPGGIVKTTTLQRVARVLNPRRNLLSAKQAANTSRKDVIIHGDKAYQATATRRAVSKWGSQDYTSSKQKGLQRSRQL